MYKKRKSLYFSFKNIGNKTILTFINFIILFFILFIINKNIKQSINSINTHIHREMKNIVKILPSYVSDVFLDNFKIIIHYYFISLTLNSCYQLLYEKIL